MSVEIAGRWLEEILVVSALIAGFEAVRGPTHALDPEKVDGVLQDAGAAGKLRPEGIQTLAQALEGEDPEAMCEWALKMRRRLEGVLTDSEVYVNDDKDREITVAQMALCEALHQVRAHCGGRLPTGQLQGLWEEHGCAELAG